MNICRPNKFTHEFTRDVAVIILLYILFKDNGEEKTYIHPHLNYLYGLILGVFLSPRMLAVKILLRKQNKIEGTATKNTYYFSVRVYLIELSWK